MRTSLLVLLGSAVSAVLAAPPRPEGINCRLTTPPPTAGEEFSHGVVLRVFPRARDITAEYSGCQITWMPDRTKWLVLSITELERGDPVRLWSPHSDDPRLTACRFKKGRVVSGNAEYCVAPQSLLKKSLAPGCVKKLQEAAASAASGSNLPPGCGYE